MIDPLGALIWSPSDETIAATRMASFREFVEQRIDQALPDTPALHAWSITDPGEFWNAVWDFFGVIGDKGDVPYRPVDFPEAVFFPDATLNLAENILREIPERDDNQLPFLIATGESGGGVAMTETLTRDEVLAQVAATAAVLVERGVQPGERVVLVLPVGVPAFIVTLAALSLGAVVASASPEFGVPAITDRFGQLDPAVLIATTSYTWAGKRYDRRDELVELTQSLPTLRALLVVPGTDDPASPVDPDVVDITKIAALVAAGSGRPLRVDLLADAQRTHADASLHFERLPMDHPAYVLFSSGTTGKPKCLIHRQGGVLLKHLVEAGLSTDAHPGDRLLFATSTGWMVWNWAISAPATGATLVLHSGAPHYPAPDMVFALADLVRLTHVGLGARLLDAMRGQGLDLTAGRDLDPLRMVLVTGSPLSASTAVWLHEQLGPTVMVNPISGGTDLIGTLIGGDPTQPVWAGQMTAPSLGIAIDVVDESGVPIAAGEPGELVCRATFPTVPLGIWGDEGGQRLHDTYFAQIPGMWTHGDLTSRTPQGGFIIHGRSDATLNVGGVRIGTGEIYEILEAVPEVVEGLAFAQPWDGDTRMVLLVVLAAGVELDDDLRDRLRATLRERGSPRHVPGLILAVDDLPRTLTGKIAEIAVADTVAGRPVRNRDALANPTALDAIEAVVAAASTVDR